MQAFRAVLRVLFFNSVNITRLSVVLFELVVLGEGGGGRVSHTITLERGCAQLIPTSPYTLWCRGFNVEGGGGVTIDVLVPLFELAFI